MNKISTASSIAHSAIAVLIVGAAFAMANADAANERTHVISATAACSGPIPSSDAALRRSPLGVRNQGTSAVFISCSVSTDYEGDQASGSVSSFFQNFGSTDATVNCTLTAGNRFQGFASVAGSIVVAAGNYNQVLWNSVDKIAPLGSYNFSCILPPGVEITTVSHTELDERDGL